MDIIYNNFINELKQCENSYKCKIETLELRIKKKEEDIEKHKQTHSNLESEISSLINKNIELQEDMENFNKVSLLKNIHSKYDKLKHKNDVLKKRVNFYKNKLVKNDLYSEDTIDLTSNSFDNETELEPNKDIIEIKSELNKVDVEKEVHVKEELVEDKEESDDFEEITVELMKIKRRFYYIEKTDEEIIVYKAIKIKKGDYEVGNKIGTLVNDKIVKI